MESQNKRSIFSNIPKPVWNILGSVFVGVGIIGIIVPLLPTTPFLLLAGLCFNQGSEKMRNWFKNNKLVGSYISNYYEKKGVSVRSKIIAIIILWITIGISIHFIPNIYIRIILAMILVGVTIYLISLPTLKDK
ncbi:MAG TPA: DUF454 family protein [Bacteroidales bacterium]|nr:DUF454 family protein [Bacteroidales bacterium]